MPYNFFTIVHVVTELDHFITYIEVIEYCLGLGSSYMNPQFLPSVSQIEIVTYQSYLHVVKYQNGSKCSDSHLEKN